MAILQIAKKNQAIIDEWHHNALHDDSVWPYLSFVPRYILSSCDDGDDWDNVYMMDDKAIGLLQFSPARQRNNQEANVSLWVLSHPAKKRVAGLLIKQLPILAKRYGVNFLTACCHETNTDSERVLRRVFGEPWGVAEGHAWNGKTGEWEDSIHFRVRVCNLNVDSRKI